MGSFHSQHYKYGLRTKSYFDRHVFSDERTRELFRTTKLSRQRALQLFKAFVKMDTDRSGEISLREFHRFFGIKRTTFTERVFGLLDGDQSGNLSFHEVAIGVWNFCTFNTVLLAKFVWDVFDIDELGWLSIDEMDALVRMVFNENEANSYSMEQIVTASCNSGGLAFDKFASLVQADPDILQPATTIQRALRKKLFGEKYWEQRSQMRLSRFGMSQIPFGTPWDAVTNCLSAPITPAHESGAEASNCNKTLPGTECDLPLVSLAEERREDRLRRKLRDVESLLRNEFTMEESDTRKELRAQLWKLADDVESARFDTLEAQAERELGGSSLGEEVKGALSSEREKEQVANPLRKKKLMGKIIPAKFTMGSRFIVGSSVLPSDEAKRDEIHEKFEKLHDSFEEEWRRVLVQYEEDFGPRATSWEQLFDRERQRRFHFNWRTGQRHDEQEIAICESCDSLIAGDDFKCLVCGSGRSEINRKRYKGRVPLDEMVKADRKAFSVP